MLEPIINRINGLDKWVDEQGVKKEQAHLKKDTKERQYWHYGYLVALKDVLALLNQNNIIVHRHDTIN